MVTGPRIRLPAQYEDMVAVKVDAVTDYCWIVMFFPQFIVFSLCQRLYFLKFVLQNNEMVASGVESAGLPKHFRSLSIGGDCSIFARSQRTLRRTGRSSISAGTRPSSGSVTIRRPAG